MMLPRLLATTILLLSLLPLTGCGAGGDSPITITTASTSTGATASLAWDHDPNPSIVGYYVYYGTESSGQSGSCVYTNRQFVSGSPTTVTNLDHNTRYYFAVSATNGLESPCSDEATVLTPHA